MPWRTISKAASSLVAGDTVTVMAGGAYDEAVSVRNSGTPGNAITYQAGSGPKPKVRRFDLTNKSYITISGFEFTNTDFTPDTISSLIVTGTTGVQILNNFIHDTTTITAGIRSNSSGAKAKELRVAGNVLANIGTIGKRGVGIELWADNSLVENNDISHTEDFTRLIGNHNVLRNNNLHDSYVAEKPVAHIDGMQSFCAGTTEKEAANYVLLEGNNFHDNPDHDSHFALINSTMTCGGSTTVIIRGNSIYRVGDAVYGANDPPGFIDNHKYYNNTAVSSALGTPEHATVILSGVSYGSVLNNIFVDVIINRPPYEAYQLDKSGTSSGDYNLAYMTAGTPAWANPISGERNRRLNLDPLFTDKIDFHLKSSSPARNAGGPLTKVDSRDTGIGTSLVVTDAHFFQDGWAGVLPDWIAVGSTDNAVQISSINYSTNTINLASPIARSAGQPVWLYKNSSGQRVLFGKAPDLGAFPHQ
jgi:hypothetical protein